jgi:hypothetical protein
MSIGDSVGKKTVDDIEAELLPQAEAAIARLVSRLEDVLNDALDRLDGTSIVMTIRIPPRGVGPEK